MTHEELAKEVAELRAEVTEWRSQLQFAIQRIVDLETTLAAVTKGQILHREPQPGFEKTVVEFPVPDNSPVYRLVPTPPIKKSSILSNNGQAFRANGSHK